MLIRGRADNSAHTPVLAFEGFLVGDLGLRPRLGSVTREPVRWCGKGFWEGVPTPRRRSPLEMRRWSLATLATGLRWEGQVVLSEVDRPLEGSRPVTNSPGPSPPPPAGSFSPLGAACGPEKTVG